MAEEKPNENSSDLPKVIVYNPRAVFFTMPLGPLAVASALDRSQVEVVIIDGRLEADPVAAVAQHLDRAVVFAVSALTGAPLRDALAVSQAVKQRRPDLPVVWGGWHPSLFPVETLKEPSIDITVVGQGEETFARLVERLLAGESLDGLQGIAYRNEGRIEKNPPRPLVDMNDLAPHDYGLLEVERYFKLKGSRQFDYISSTGCPFRCAFCADPFVFQRKWVAVSPERMGIELQELWQRFHFDELAFQDETFFTYANRVGEIASQLLERGVKARWTATLRADQATRLDESTFALCVESGFDRAMIGVESGSQEMLDWMQKDIKVEQVLDAAALCAKYSIGAIFPFIVGFPDETPESVEATTRMIKRLRSMSPRFETPVFYFKPYPGSMITNQLVAKGFTLPDTVEGWADFDFIGSSGPWVSADKERFIERFKFYNRFAGGPETFKRRPLQWLARWRCRHDAYGLPWEKAVVDRLWPQPELS